MVHPANDPKLVKELLEYMKLEGSDSFVIAQD
jgi:sulfite reductase alpha subunit-like flavoprotein